jgi:hypothetical protein
MNERRFVSALRELLPLSDGELEQIISYASGLDDAEAAHHLGNLLGNSPKSLEFISSFLDTRATFSYSRDVGVEESSSSLSTYLAHNNNDSKAPPRKIDDDAEGSQLATGDDQEAGSHPPPYTAISGSQISRRINQHASTHHTNDLIEASKIRARDEV